MAKGMSVIKEFHGREQRRAISAMYVSKYIPIIQVIQNKRDTGDKELSERFYV